MVYLWRLDDDWTSPREYPVVNPWPTCYELDTIDGFPLLLVTITINHYSKEVPTIWTHGKAEAGRVREEKRREEERRSEKRKSQRKEDAGARKGRKVAIHGAFPMICGSGGSKSIRSKDVQNTPFSEHFWKVTCWKSARRCGAKHNLKSKCRKHLTFGALLEVAMSKKCTPLWCEAYFHIKMHKAPQCRTAFGSWHVEKVHVFVARSTCRSQKCKRLTGAEHFWTGARVCLPACLSVCLPASLKTKLFCETSSVFELDNVKNETILRDFLNFRTWQNQKRSKSARLPQFSKFTTSKTKQFSETSFKNGKLSAELMASCQCVLRFVL